MTLWNNLLMLSTLVYFRRQFGILKRENKTVCPLFIDCNHGASHQLWFARVAAFLSGQQKSGNGKISKVKSLDEKVKRYNNFFKFSAAYEDAPLLDELEK